MNANVQSEPSNALDMLKWFIIIALLTGMVVANNVYAETSMFLRAGVFVVVMIVCLALASQTTKGKTFLVFAKDSRVEVRKVVWPNRQEATQTTMIIGATTMLVALVLWGLDALLLWAVGFVTGLRF